MPIHRQFRLEPAPGLLGWLRFGLSLAAAVAVGVLIIALAISLTVVLLPVVGVILLIAAWRFRKLAASLRRSGFADRPTQGPRVIETEYTVIDGRRPQEPPSR